MGVLLKLTEEYFGTTIRAEEGKVFEIGGKKYAIKYEDYKFIKDIVPIGDNGECFMEIKSDIFEEPTYFCKIEYKGLIGNTVYDYYRITKSALDNKFEKNIIDDGLIMWISSTYDVFSDDFLIVKILKKVNDGFDKFNLTEDIEISKFTKYYSVGIYGVENKFLDIKIYSNRDDAVEYAINEVEYSLDNEYGNNLTKDDVDDLRKTYGDDWLDIDGLKDFFQGKFEKLYDDKHYKKGEHGSEFIDELIDKGLINDDDSYFNVDKEYPKFDINGFKDFLISCMVKEQGMSEEDATKEVEEYTTSEFSNKLIEFDIVDENDENFELDYDSPKFDEKDIIEELIKEKLEDISDVVDEYISNFGKLPSYYYDLDELAKIMVNPDDITEIIATLDKKEHTVEIDGKTYFVYIS